MALTRKLLKGMGLTEEQVDSIIDAHIESLDHQKAETEKYKTDAEKLPAVQKELDDLKAAGDGGYKKRYEDEHTAFEQYKADQTKKATRAAKETAYRALLKAAGVADKYIDKVIKVTDIEALEMDGDKIKDEATHTTTIKVDWADFIPTTTSTGVDTATPPGNNTTNPTDLGSLSMEDYIAARKKM